MAHVVITGAAGFIGSHVAEYFEEKGVDVVKSDLLIPKDADSTWKKADLTSIDDMLDLTRGVTEVCHLGGIGDVYLAARDPRLAILVNCYGTANILEACVRNRVERFVYASTWEVYGTPQYQPIDELHPCAPSHPYGISKLAGDLYVRNSVHHTPLETIVLRLSTAFGPRMRESAVIPAFISSAIRKLPIQIQGEGNQFRQFTHVRDIAHAFRLALERGLAGSVYNIASPEAVSIRELAERIVRRIPTQVLFTGQRPGDAPSALLQSSRANDELGWYPRVTFEQGLGQMIDSSVSEYLPRAERPNHRAV